MTRNTSVMNRDGLLLIDKPAGRTSAWIARRVGKILNVKAGHAGTLDPPATGLLIVGVGEGVKVLHHLSGQSKRYRACVRLGVKTSTGDAAGETFETCDYVAPDETRLKALFGRFTGELQQTPPMHSALKVGGERLHRLARRGRTVERKPRRVTIHSLALKSLSAVGFCFDVHCSKGTYVRVLAEDMGSALGTVAHLSSLRRTASGGFSVDDAVDVQTLDACRDDPQEIAQRLLPVDAGLQHLPAVGLDEARSDSLRCGGWVAADGLPADGLLRVYDEHGRLLAVAESDGERLRPKRVFHARPPGGGTQSSYLK